MTYYTDLFSPETFEAFSRSQRDVSGFRMRQLNLAKRIRTGDKFVCYMTKFGRWVGILEVLSDFYIEESSLFYPDDDPFVVRFKVGVISWLPKEKTIPIHEQPVWNTLSFTKDAQPTSSTWTGKIRMSLNRLAEDDGRFLETLLASQVTGGHVFPIPENKYQKFVLQRIRGATGAVAVTVPVNDDDDSEPEINQDNHHVRESAQIQALLARCGEKMGFKVWLPKNDRLAVLQGWKPEDGTLIDVLPLNYDETTIRTIEQIDVLRLSGRVIARAFEVEHTTAIYSGILRMADLLALQPNMKIKLHIVAPEIRKNKVFTEIQRPVFSLLETGPLYECCTFISYDSLRELSEQQHLEHLSDSVLEEYAEEAE